MQITYSSSSVLAACCALALAAIPYAAVKAQSFPVKPLRLLNKDV